MTRPLEREPFPLSRRAAWHNATRKGKKARKGLNQTREKRSRASRSKTGRSSFSPDPATALIYLCVLLNSRDLMPIVLEIAEDEEDAKDLLNAAAVASRVPSRSKFCRRGKKPRRKGMRAQTPQNGHRQRPKHHQDERGARTRAPFFRSWKKEPIRVPGASI
jgi:hypothetical protein